MGAEAVRQHDDGGRFVPRERLVDQGRLARARQAGDQHVTLRRHLPENGLPGEKVVEVNIRGVEVQRGHQARPALGGLDIADNRVPGRDETATHGLHRLQDLRVGLLPAQRLPLHQIEQLVGLHHQGVHGVLARILPALQGLDVVGDVLQLPGEVLHVQPRLEDLAPSLVNRTRELREILLEHLLDIVRRGALPDPLAQPLDCRVELPRGNPNSQGWPKLLESKPESQQPHRRSHTPTRVADESSNIARRLSKCGAFCNRRVDGVDFVDRVDDGRTASWPLIYADERRKEGRQTADGRRLPSCRWTQNAVAVLCVLCVLCGKCRCSLNPDSPFSAVPQGRRLPG